MISICSTFNKYLLGRDDFLLYNFNGKCMLLLGRFDFLVCQSRTRIILRKGFVNSYSSTFTMFSIIQLTKYSVAFFLPSLLEVCIIYRECTAQPKKAKSNKNF